jgi:staphyloferrin B synthase
MFALAADTPKSESHLVATDEVLRDLIDALLNDGLITIAPANIDTDTDSVLAREVVVNTTTSGARTRGCRLVFRVRSATPPFPRPWRYSRGPVLLVDPAATDNTDSTEGTGEPLDAAGVVRALARPSWTALDLVADDLAAAPEAVVAAAHAGPRVAEAVAAGGLEFQAGERLAALRDRPFHPLGRHKRGWAGEDAARWGPHAARPFGLAWWAVPRSALDVGEAADCEPADALDPADRDRLDAAAARCGVDGADHVVLPVHPWQARHLGERRLGAVPLADGLGAFRAMASLRTLAPAGRPGLHLKLPLAVAALGAGRQLAVRYLRNGDRAQRLLASVSRHPALSDRVHVCDETAWWSNPGPAEPGEGELGCQVRRYPRIATEPDVTLLPLAALGVTVAGRAPALEALAAPLDRGSGAALLAQLTDELVRLAVVGLAHGVMPEMHGQNVVVVVRPGDRVVSGLVLRDHDAVRIHPPWLRAAGLPDPGYVVDGRTPNTLVAESPEGLLAWFQMLGVHLGLFPVVEALAAAAGLAEADGWRTIAAATGRCLDRLAAEPGLGHAAAVARRQLLDEPTWPVKLVMGPLLERGGSCGTSMPSAIGTTANPLVSHRHSRPRSWGQDPNFGGENGVGVTDPVRGVGR